MFKNWFNRSRSKCTCRLHGKQVATGKELIFISRINRDGKGVTDVSNERLAVYDNVVFVLNSLSVTNKTYIACEFNSFVVRLVN
jgi:hypothetical protein